VNILRRLPLPRLLLLCGLVIAIGVSATALAFALSSGPTPPPEPLAQAIRSALGGPRGKPIEGVSASIVLTDHLLEGASLAGGGQAGELTSNPLVTGASGRLWIAKDGDVRLELQSESGDTQILYDGHTLSLYDAATNTLYRYTVPAASGGSGSPTPASAPHEAPTVANIEQAIAHLSQHADVSGAIATDVAGQPAYTVRVSPREGGSLLGGAELSWDADNGVPLRAAIYSSASSAPVIELAATEVSFGSVAGSVFKINPPASARIEEIKTPSASDTRAASSDARAAHRSARRASRPKLTTRGHGLSTIAVLASSRYGESKTGAGAGNSAGGSLEDLPKVTIDGVSASELRTELGTLLTFERSGVRYLIAGAVGPAAVEEAARGL
jgi:outer membrane lipoprotein-sorting protein